MSNLYTAFAGTRRIAAGGAAVVALAAKESLESSAAEPILIFDDATSRTVDFDLRGSREDILARLSAAGLDGTATALPARGPGRPKLGVVAREITLLPRHWEWLNAQPGGASVALRKLVEAARKSNAETDRIRLAREAVDRFMSVMAGNQSGYEDAAWALYANDAERFTRLTEIWPPDIRDHARQMAAAAFAETHAADDSMQAL